MILHRRAVLAGLAAAALPRTGRGQGAARDLLEAARSRARRPHAAEAAALPPPFAGLDYDSYRGIRPRPERAGGLPLGPGYAVDLLPPGFYFTHPVTVEIASGGTVRRVPFSTELFAFDPRHFGAVPPGAPTGAGFSGLRLRHPVNAPGRMDEVLVLQGGSYFRAIGRGMVYGLSARALAIGTGTRTPEVFPTFEVLRVHAPGAADDPVRIEALIDSPPASAHLDLTVRPGAETVTRATVTVFPREDIADVGIAPLTSMYAKGTLRAAVLDDFRPAVHDSDALWIANGAGETLWRPLSNPAALQISAFADDGPEGFGLIQTPRAFAAYEDAEAAYHRRPSARVVPAEAWGAGAVMLVEIPTSDEFMDNVVAFWRPADPLRAGGAYRFAYDIVWTLRPPPLGGLAPVAQSRSGRVPERPGALRYVVDFDGAAGEAAPDLSVTGGGAAVEGLAAFPLPEADRLRVTFLLLPGGATAAELRLVLRDAAGRPLSPVWLHRWTPARDGGP